MTVMTLASMSPKSSNLRLRGVFSFIWDAMDLWISPMAVLWPVKTTTAWAFPFTTVVPWVRESEWVDGDGEERMTNGE